MSTEQEKQAVPTIRVVELNPEDVDKLRFDRSVYFEYDSPIDGKLVGNLTFHKMDIGGYTRKAIYKARLNGGVPLQDIDPLIDEMNDKIAHLMVWFEKMESRPEWAKDFTKLRDVTTIGALFKEGDSFEATFRGAVGKRP